MLKKFVYTLAAAAMTFGFAACSSDEPLAGAAGQDGLVTFTAQLPAELASRAFGEGENAKKLTVYVYEKDVKTLIETKTADFPADALTTTVELQLVNGKSYDILFWADAYGENGADTPFSYTASTQTVKVDYTKMASNEDKGDAFFFAEKGLAVNGAINKTVTLTRPFAQINFGTDDLNAASVKNAFGITADNTFGKLKSELAFTAEMPDQLNLFDGKVKTTAGAAATAFAAVAPTEEDTFPYGTGYDYLSMSYVLVGADRDVVDLKYTVLNGTTEYNTLNITAVPVQRNYRTNIYGSLLTSKVNFNVVINPGFEDPDYNLDQSLNDGEAKVDGVKYNTLSEALSAVKTAGKTEATVALGNGEFSANDLSAAANSLTTLTISGQGPATVINKTDAGNYLNGVNINFNNLTLRSTNANYNGFQHNASETYNGCVIENKLFLYGKAKFENCTFKNDGDYSVWTYGAPEATFENCTFGSSETTFANSAAGNYGKSILIYNEGSRNTVVNVNNCTFYGTPLNDGKAAIEIDCSFNTGDDLYTLNINNTTVNGFDEGLLSGNNVWNVKKGTRFEVYVDGEQKTQGLTTDGNNAYFVNAPEGLVRLSKLVNGYYKDGRLSHNTFSGKTVTMTADVDMADVPFKPIGLAVTSYPGEHFAGTFDGANHTISNLTASANTPNWATAGLFGALVGNVKNVTLQNVNITSTHYAGGIAGYVDNNTGSLIDNCKVIGGTITSTTEQIGNGWDNGDKAGGILGYGCTHSNKVTNCTVEGVTIKAYRHIGSIVGYAGNTANVTGNTAKNVTMSWDSTHDYKNFGTIDNVPFGPIVGSDKTYTGNNTADNVTLPTEE